MPISKKKGERKPDFINRCVGIEVASGKRANQAVAICNNYWEELSLKELNKKRKEQKLEDHKMITAFKGLKGEDFTQFGITREDLLNPKKMMSVSEDEHLLTFAEIPEGYEVRYRYEGPLDEKSRPFCKMMMTTYENEWWSREQIESLNTEPGKANRKGNKPYSVFNWRGGNYCRHQWVRYYFNPTTNDVLDSPVQPNQKSTNPK